MAGCADSHFFSRNGLPKIVLWGLLVTVLMLAFVVTVLLAPQHALSCAMTSNPPGSPAHSPPKSAPAWMGGLTKDEFVNAVLRAPVEGLPDVAAIRQKCEHDTKWQPGLVWFCAPVNPGLVNALISVLDCLRYALEAGGKLVSRAVEHLHMLSFPATTIVFPGVTRRSHNNLTEVGSEDDDDWSNPPSVFFDVPFFTEVWGKACPEMHTIAWQPRMKDLPGGKDSIFIHPPHIAPFEFDGRMPVNANAWRPAFDIWMVDHANAYATMSPEKPLRLYQAKTILEFNPRADPLPFMHTFARSVRFSMQARRLAASALWELGRIVGHPLAPVSATEAAAYSSAARDALEGPNVPNVNELQPGRLTKPGFMGVHLRTEVDVPDLWLPYRAQAAAYINEARQRRMRFVVVATGSAEVSNLER